MTFLRIVIPLYITLLGEHDPRLRRDRPFPKTGIHPRFRRGRLFRDHALGKLFEDRFHRCIVECGQRLGAHIAELANAQAKHCDRLGVGRLQDGDHVISAERPIERLYGHACFLGFSLEGSGALG